MVVTVLLIVFLCFVPAQSEERLFYGGSISCTQETIGGKAIAHVEIVTGWKLGKGPCGRNCSQKDVGKLTNAARIQADHVTGTSGFFGNFSAYYTINSKSVFRDINSAVISNFREHVISVNEKEQWEQESLEFSIGMEDFIQTINYDFMRWNLRCRMRHEIRNDLKRMNSSPKIVMDPYYRVNLNSKSTISLPMIDPDGDIIRCELSAFVEREAIPIPAGVTVQPSKTTTNLCKITIDANASLGYRNDSWIAIPLTARDYPTTDILFGNDSVPAGTFSLSSITAKFHVQVLEHILTPIIVRPTAPEGHKFVVYVGATWKTDIYAEASENATVDRFVSFGLDRENVTMSYTKDDTTRQHVRYATMFWDPSFGDIGQHTLCTRAEDNNGVDSFDQRCFIVHVRENDFNHSVIISMGKPGFFNMPSTGQSVSCEIGASCLLPVFVKSTINLASVYVTENFTEEANIDALEMVSHDVYKATLSFIKPTPWVDQICLKAANRNNITGEELCVNVVAEYPDACLSGPCRKSGRCRSDRTTGTFVCECLSHTYGRVCEHKKGLCREEWCVTGQTAGCYDLITDFYCLCKSGFSGEYCEANVNDCRNYFCNSTTGVCRDLVIGVVCDCYQRYNGTDCSIDKCPSEDRSILQCPAAGCSLDMCSGHGVCTHGGLCVCRLGYDTDAHCSKPVLHFPGVDGVKFVPPSPVDRSQFICFMNRSVNLGLIQPCHLQIYVATVSGKEPVLSVETTDELKFNSTLGLVKTSSVLQGINNLYSSDITIRGMVKPSGHKFICVNAYEGPHTDKLCLELKFVLQVVPQSHTLHGFIAPTQLEGSRLTGYVDQRYTIVLYTSFSSQCEDVIPLTEGVTVFPSIYDGYGSCVTEATVYLKEGESDICFQSAKTNFEIRCFTAEGLHNNTDPCLFSPCQNGGHCFPNGTNGTNRTNEFHCICQEHYSGDLCQEGPCQLNDCMNNAYCQTINGTNSCVCKVGFTGDKCELNSANNKAEISFANTAIPESFQCVLDHSCSLALPLTCGKDIACRPGVSTAYISPTIIVGEISLISRNEPGNYQVNIKLVGKEVGLQQVCIGIHNTQGLYMDEMCFKVDIITDVSKVYGFQNRPHFVDPSLPNNASVECTEEEQCHVLYQITRGHGNHHQCLSVKPGEFFEVQTYHIFTSCDLCTPTSGNCSVDVALGALSQYVGTVRRFCVQLGLTGSSTTGEERCINLKVVSKKEAKEKKGCQLVDCKNGGFFDGHVPDKPICYCRLGFTGKTCDQDIYNSPEVLPQNIQTFNGDLGIPSRIKCPVNKTCSVPFEVGAPTGGQPNIYISLDPSVSYEGHYFIPGKSNTTFSGSVDVISSSSGTFPVCLQTMKRSGVIDEMCVQVQFSGITHSADLRRPRFVKPSLSHGSTIVCETNKSCHLLLNFTKADAFGFPGICPTLTQLNADYVEGLHIFQPEYNAKDCVSDVVYLANVPVTRSLCLRLTLPGKNGEIRCYALKAVNNVTSEVHLSTNHNILVNPTVASSLLSGMSTRTSIRISTQLTTIADPCQPDPCVHGTCFSSGTIFLCVCPPNYTGRLCEKSVSGCEPNPCVRGVCFSHESLFYCQCPTGFTGKMCEKSVDQNPSIVG